VSGARGGLLSGFELGIVSGHSWVFLQDF